MYQTNGACAGACVCNYMHKMEKTECGLSNLNDLTYHPYTSMRMK